MEWGTAYSATWTVNTHADTFDGVCDTLDCSIRDALHEAANNPGDDTVVIPAGPTEYQHALACLSGPENDNLCGDFDLYDVGNVPSLLIIRGLPAGQYMQAVIRSTLSGAARERIFHVPSPTEGRTAPRVRFENLMLLDGYQEESTADTFGGGCIGNESASPMDLWDSSVMGCTRVATSTGARGGGGIDTIGQLRLVSAHVDECASIDAPGGGIHADTFVQLTQSKVRYNGVNGTCGSPPCGFSGGGLFLAEVGTVLSTFTDWLGNEAQQDGGAIAMSEYEAVSTLTINRGKFHDNVAVTGAGGAVFAPTAVPSVFEGDFGDNSALGAGGAAYLGLPTSPTGVTFIWRSSFWGNDSGTSVDRGEGGALAFDGLSATAAGIGRIENTTFSGNTAHPGSTPSGHGGAIKLFDPAIADSELVVVHATFNNNAADRGSEVWGGSGWKVSFRNSILRASDVTNDCWGSATFGSDGYNRTFGDPDYSVCLDGGIGVDEETSDPLGALTYFNMVIQPTKIHSVSTGSAYRLPTSGTCHFTVDQHGTSRATSRCYAGAFEAP